MIRLPFALLLASALLTSAASADEQPAPETPRGDFMLADVDGDGRVTVDELETLLNARFSVLDADSDGRVAVGDLQRPSGGRMRGPPSGAFHGPPPGKHPPGPPPGPPPGGVAGPGRPPEMADDFPFPQPEDADEDGFISRAEFVAPAAAMLDYWDRNRDGAVTADEAHPTPDR